jgi:hypothetical protein
MTKYYRLFSLLKSAGSKGASPEVCAKELSFQVGSVAPYMNSLRTKFGAKIEVVKDGRSVTAYKLMNVAEVEKNITPNRRGATTVAAKVAKPSKKLAKAASKTAVAKVQKTIKSKAASPREDEFDVPTLDADLSVSEVTDSELADLRHQLGL